MLKCHFLILFFILVLGTYKAQSQVSTDTVMTGVDSVVSARDSSAIDTVSPLSGLSGEDSVYQPVLDSLFLSVYKPRLVPVVKINKWKADPDYQYANDSAYWKEEVVRPDTGSFWDFLRVKWVQWFFFAVVTLAIIVGIYLLVRENNLKWFFRKTKNSVLSQPENQAGPHINHDEAISENENKGNYRIAVRYLYLRLIHSIREKKSIPIRDSTTNAEITEAFGSNPLSGEFRYLTRAYEYVYYGDFLITAELFRTLKLRFENFQLKVNS